MDEKDLQNEEKTTPKTSSKSLEDDPLIIIAKRIIAEHIGALKALAKYDEDNKK